MGMLMGDFGNFVLFVEVLFVFGCFDVV